MGGVVYEDPWLAGGHNGLSNSEDPTKPENPYPRVMQLRREMREFGLGQTPILMAGGVWNLSEWEDWIDNPELGPIAFQFGTRALLTKESPIPDTWKRRLMDAEEGRRFSQPLQPHRILVLGRQQQLHQGTPAARQAPGRLHHRADGRPHRGLLGGAAQAAGLPCAGRPGCRPSAGWRADSPSRCARPNRR